MILEHEIRELVVDLRRLAVGMERAEKLPVPARRLGVVGGLLLTLLRVLVLRVIVGRQILQVALQVTQHFRRLVHVEVLPVLALQAIGAREVLLRGEHELRECTLFVDFDHPHAEVRRCLMVRVQGHEGFVDRGGVLIAKLDQVELREVAVDPVLVGSVSVGGEVRAKHVRTADVGEAQADDLEGILDAPLLGFGVLRIEVIAALDLVVEESEVARQSLLVELRLVQRPSQLVEGELVVLRARPAVDDRRVGALRLPIFPRHEEMLGAAELHLVCVSRARIFAGQLLHDFQRRLCLPELVIGARLLIEHLVAEGVLRVLRQQLVVQLDRLEGPGALAIGIHAGRQRQRRDTIRRRDHRRRRCPLLEVPFRHCR